jgi:DNA polymerase I-like protein with 3'-5' exonuclease and polymerase domains
MGIKMLATVHDEVVLECNNEFVGKVSEVVPKLMSMTTNLVVPLKADAGVGPNYSVAK